MMNKALESSLVKILGDLPSFPVIYSFVSPLKHCTLYVKCLIKTTAEWQEYVKCNMKEKSETLQSLLASFFPRLLIRLLTMLLL